MWNDLFVTFDLHRPGQTYPTVERAIKLLGPAKRTQTTAWFVRSLLTATQARDIIAAMMDHNDTLTVIDATNDTYAVYNASPDVIAFLEAHWSKAVGLPTPATVGLGIANAFRSTTPDHPATGRLSGFGLGLRTPQSNAFRLSDIFKNKSDIF